MFRMRPIITPSGRKLPAPDGDQVAWAAQKRRHNHRAQRTGHQRGKRRAGRPHRHAVDKQRIAADVQHIDHNRHLHGNAGIALRTEQRGARVIDGEEGVGQGGK